MNHTGIIKIITKTFGLKLQEKSSNNKALVFAASGDRKEKMRKIAESIGGEYKSGTVTRMENQHKFRSKTGAVVLGDFTIFLRTVEGATEALQINALSMAAGGSSATFDWLGKKVDSFKFTNPAKLKASILRGLKTNSKVSNSLYKWVNQLLSSPDLSATWTMDIREYEKKELAKYLGELLIGYVALLGEMKKFTSGISNKFPPTLEFLIPKDPSFSGIDSVLRDTNTGELFPISSKSGAGANASIWSNLMVSGFEYFSSLKPCKFKNLIKIGKARGITYNNILKPLQNKIIIYNYGLNHILKIPRTKIKNGIDIYNAVKQKKTTPALIYCLDAIKDHKFTKATPALQKNLIINDAKKIYPQGITGFFCMTIASDLNSDAASIKESKKILIGKSFTQANLDIKNWLINGKLHFNLIKTNRKMHFQFAGNKAGYGAIAADNGTLNYQIRGS